MRNAVKAGCGRLYENEEACERVTSDCGRIIRPRGVPETPANAGGRKLVFLAPTGDHELMRDGCDVCRNFRPSANSRNRTLIPVSFGEDTVVLCEMHRRIAERSGIATFQELREFYGESDGRRSYVPRRTSVPQGTPESDRRRSGRRSTDA